MSEHGDQDNKADDGLVFPIQGSNCVTNAKDFLNVTVLVTKIQSARES